MNKLEFLPDFESFSEFHFILFLCFYLQILSNTRARSKKLASLQGKRALAYLFTFSQFLKNQNKKQATLKSEKLFRRSQMGLLVFTALTIGLQATQN